MFCDFYAHLIKQQHLNTHCTYNIRINFQHLSTFNIYSHPTNTP